MPVWYRQEGHSKLLLLDRKKHFCPLLDFFMGSLKSVSELRKTKEEHFEFRVKGSHKYWGASSCRDLKTIVLDSLATSCSMVFQPSWSISGLLGVSKLLLVIILAARF